MTEFPKLIYKETEPQVVPDLNDPKSLETSLPIVIWHGKQVQIKQICLAYIELGKDNESVHKIALRVSMLEIIAQITKSHPHYLPSFFKL
ncbi:hypothetical protein [Endozoicomonas sp. ONNA2]|uniref:hypothetical protein n=1 Tax=Endozoicomonas sp. ONNA2 TaxID=2828741 RepID=UPI002149918B|nr:hypothetical protein [Endozoicomonas sp. ONNA2]